MEKVLCLRIFYRWKIITSKNYFPCLLLASGASCNDVIIIPFDNEQSIIPHNYIHLQDNIHPSIYHPPH